MDRQNHSTQVKGSSKNSPRADGKGNTNAEVNINFSFKEIPRDHILHATAIVEVQNEFDQYIPCRVLLDRVSLHIS